jgi:hypothetical protein
VFVFIMKVFTGVDTGTAPCPLGWHRKERKANVCGKELNDEAWNRSDKMSNTSDSKPRQHACP